ncbi:MAG TPA: hypothetical protein VGD91_22375 [Trebonia sp.]
MAVRDQKLPDAVRTRRPGSVSKGAVLFAALFVVLLAAVLIPVHAFGAKTGVISIPPPPPVTFGAVAAAAPPSASAVASSPAARPSPAPKPSRQTVFSPPPVAGASYAGSLVLNAVGAQLESWNQTSSYCRQEDWEVPDGSVSGDRSDDAVLATTGRDGSCVALITPQAYSSAVIEAYAYFPPLPGSQGTIADWTSLWLTDQASWPTGGELDAVEAEPATGVNAVAWHWGAAGSPQSMSTDGYAQDGTLPARGANLKPGWHVVDIVYTRGFFAVYYDGQQYTSLSSDAVTGAALNLLITSSVTPDTGEVEQTIGHAPVNSDTSPAGMAVKYVKVWSFK